MMAPFTVMINLIRQSKLYEKKKANEADNDILSVYLSV